MVTSVMNQLTFFQQQIVEQMLITFEFIYFVSKWCNICYESVNFFPTAELRVNVDYIHIYLYWEQIKYWFPKNV